MDEIRNIVKKVVAGIASTKKEEQKDIQKSWNKILSEKEKKHAKISGLKNGILMINVDSAPWLYQFNLRKREILKTLQGEGYDVKTIYIKTGKTR